MMLSAVLSPTRSRCVAALLLGVSSLVFAATLWQQLTVNAFATSQATCNHPSLPLALRADLFATDPASLDAADEDDCDTDPSLSGIPSPATLTTPVSIRLPATTVQ